MESLCGNNSMEDPISTNAPTTPDQLVYEVVSAATPATIADVIAVMKSIDALLPGNDGLKWFNRLYLMVTDQVNVESAWRRVAKSRMARSS